MKALTRLRAYQKQNGGSRLTARQHRRMAHKGGHQAAKFERNMMVIAANMAALKDAGVDLDQGKTGHARLVFTRPAACPRCNASGDEVCKTASGSAAKSRHAGRDAA